MRIEQMELTAFRSFSSVTIPTNAGRVLIAGVNGVGKTTIREVVKWVLTGRCQGLDGKGAGWEVLSPVGRPIGVGAGLTLSGLGKVARTAQNGSGGLTVHGFTGTSQTQQVALYAKLNTLPAVVDAVLDTGAFLDLHHADAKALVLNLLNVHITLGDQPNGPTYSLAELDALYQQAFEDRKVAKKVLQQLGTPMKPADEPQPTVAAVDEQLRKLRHQLETVATAIGETAGRRRALLRQQADLKGPRLTVQPPDPDRMLEVEERLAMLEADVLPAAVLDQPTDEAPLIVLQQRVASLNAHKPTKGCVLDSGVPCKTPRSDFRNAAKLIEAEMATRTEAPPAPTGEGASLLTTLRKELAGLNQRQTVYDAWQAADRQRQQDLQAVDTELAGLPDTTTQDEQIALLKSRIQKGEQILRQAQVHWAAVKAYEEQDVAREQRRQDVDRLEAMCATLGPNGVRVQALQEAIGRFETLVNVSTSQFGWQVRFLLDPWAVLVNDRPVETYSKSEQFRIGIAVQLAIAALSGIGFAMIDELDMLDVQNRGLVTQMVMQAPLEQVFVLGTREPGVPLPKNAGVLAYRLGQQDGQSVVVEQSGMAMVAA